MEPSFSHPAIQTGPEVSLGPSSSGNLGYRSSSVKQNPASSEQPGIVQPGPEGKALTRTTDLDLRK